MSLFKTEWTEVKIRAWRAAQAMGRDRWILTRWILGWAGSMALGSTAISLLCGASESKIKSQLLIGLVVWPLTGLILGSSVWARTEHSYQKHVERRVF